jgi:hypothetical protein
MKDEIKRNNFSCGVIFKFQMYFELQIQEVNEI